MAIIMFVTKWAKPAIEEVITWNAHAGIVRIAVWGVTHTARHMPDMMPSALRSASKSGRNWS